MLKELFNLVKEAAAGPVIDNPQIPNEQNDPLVAEATNTVASGLRNMVAGGGLENIISLFNGNGDTSSKGLLSNPMVNMMIGHLTGKLMTNHNLNGNQAAEVANNLVPDVISKLVNKTNDPNDSSFSIESLLNSITGGQTTEVIREQQESGNAGINFQDLISQFSGGSQNGGGGLMDIVSRFAGGARDQQQKNGGGGLMDLINGFLK